MGVDYGVSHMAFPIVFNYWHGNIHCMRDMLTPAQRIKALRKKKLLTQVQLATAAEIDQSTLSDIENEKGFSAEILMRLADALGTTPQIIMRGEDLDQSALLAQIKALLAGQATEQMSIPQTVRMENPPMPKNKSPLTMKLDAMSRPDRRVGAAFIGSSESESSTNRRSKGKGRSKRA